VPGSNEHERRLAGRTGFELKKQGDNMHCIESNLARRDSPDDGSVPVQRRLRLRSGFFPQTGIEAAYCNPVTAHEQRRSCAASNKHRVLV
jgi:hypothetical protein